MSQKEKMDAIFRKEKRESVYNKSSKNKYELERINELKNSKDYYGITFSSPVAHIPCDQQYLIEIYKKIDKDNLELTKEGCGLTQVLFSKLTSYDKENYVNYKKRNLDGQFKALALEEIKKCDVEREVVEYTIHSLCNMASYCVLYKVFNKLGFNNREISIFLESNTKYIISFDYSFYVFKDLTKVINYLKDETDMEVIANKLYHYINLMSVMNLLGIDEESKEKIVESKIEESLEENFGEVVDYKNARKNIAFLSNNAKIEGEYGFIFMKNIIENIDVILNTTYGQLISYLSVYNMAELDNEVICRDLSKINIFNNTIPSELYAVVRQMMENNKKSGFYSLDAIELIIDNYDIEVLKKKYPIKNKDSLIITDLVKNYKKKYLEKSKFYTKKLEEQRKKK